ncbi:MAG: hypothetical protein SVU88_03060, partial [Candidatus Nanohaloarchaea archaeon]|nr:hypothetical protein [Candidatus Nanohaloarchaea archaeon]
MDEDVWSEVAYVEQSSNRERVLRALVDAGRPMTPAELADELDTGVKTASRAVRGLHDHGLAASLDPDAPRDRRYRATEDARTVAARLAAVADRPAFRADATAAAEPSATYAPDRPDEVQADIDHVRRSPNRRAVLARLATVEVPLTPSEVADDLDIAFNS